MLFPESLKEGVLVPWGWGDGGGVTWKKSLRGVVRYFSGLGTVAHICTPPKGLKSGYNGNGTNRVTGCNESGTERMKRGRFGYGKSGKNECASSL